ncbi:hypothetical protein RND71_016019 [Anisodus tanguticus]|uniref:t-SNARE coiled-coil homology domain-containing protein n=1 Tax=Anisodus tanguticus TaxID=243964 RepID=A0AAE1VI85_9SOLA|nr:hypothetical protein RND71_016019 [Anisodus tanguticus]
MMITLCGNYHVKTGEEKHEVLLLDNEFAFNKAIIEEREQGIQEIQQQIGEVNEFFKDLVVLVHEQVIDDNGSNVENANIATAQGRSQLAKLQRPKDQIHLWSQYIMFKRRRGVKRCSHGQKRFVCNIAFLDQDDEGGTKISTVVPYTVLESSIYSIVRKAFVNEMPKYVKTVSPTPLFKTFFDYSFIDVELMNRSYVDGIFTAALYKKGRMGDEGRELRLNALQVFERIALLS